MSRARGFPPDVDDVSAVGDHGPCQRDGGHHVELALAEQAVAAEGVRRHVQDRHDVGFAAPLQSAVAAAGR